MRRSGAARKVMGDAVICRRESKTGVLYAVGGSFNTVSAWRLCTRDVPANRLFDIRRTLPAVDWLWSCARFG
jgi:hypothetical protein